MQIRRLILIFGIVNASLYSALLPLWEGFDEAFHYGYVETLWQTYKFPVLGKALIPADVARSFELAPLSHVVQRGIPAATSYESWFSLNRAEKERRRRELDNMVSERQWASRPNYEAHQPPLAYLAMAPLDFSLAKFPITARILVLRLLAAVSSLLLIYTGTISLCRTLELPPRFVNASLVTLFCSEMLYATIAHVANDWLSVGLSALFLASLARLVAKPDRRSMMKASLLLAAGLLTKAYFLVFALLALGITAKLIWSNRIPLKTAFTGGVVVLALAGPWYVRNLLLYKNVSGTHEEFDGIGVKQALAAAPYIHWVETAGFLARGSLWTGNNSFTSFSQSTLNALLMLLLLAFVAWATRRSAIQPAERIVFVAIALFSTSIAYATCASFAHTKGDVAGASPWYSQVLLQPVIALAYLGMSRWKKSGVVLSICTVAIWTWVLIATWAIKLFPMYSGAGPSPMRIHDLWGWYMNGAAAHLQELSLLTLAPGPLLYLGLLASLALGLFTSASVVRELVRSAPQGATAKDLA